MPARAEAETYPPLEGIVRKRELEDPLAPAEPRQEDPLGDTGISCPPPGVTEQALEERRKGALRQTSRASSVWATFPT